MDDRSFDGLARDLATVRSRRTLLSVLGRGAAMALGIGGPVGAVVWSRAGRAASCVAGGRVCREDAACCSGVCQPPDATGRRRCTCESNLTTCGNQCCTAAEICVNGSCRNPTPTATPTSTPTNTPTITPTSTPTSTPTNTPTSTPTNSPTTTATNSPTSTPTSSPTSTPTVPPGGPGTCAAGADSCAQLANILCNSSNACACYLTAAGGVFCGNISISECSDCSTDADCTALTGAGSACVLTTNFCTACPSTGRSCSAPCPVAG